jgi:hypothetical protein
MTLEASFTMLDGRLSYLDQTFSHLVWAVVEAQPEVARPEAEQGRALVDHYDRAVNDILGLVQEAKEAVNDGCQATKGQLDLARSCRALILCQDRFNQLSSCFYADLVSYEYIHALNNLAYERGGQWTEWVIGVKDALERCSQPLYDLSQVIFVCWQEVVERLGMTSVSVQATSVGQQITVARPPGVPEKFT